MYTMEEKSRVLRVYGFNSISIKMFPVPESRKQANFIIITRREGGRRSSKLGDRNYAASQKI